MAPLTEIHGYCFWLRVLCFHCLWYRFNWLRAEVGAKARWILKLPINRLLLVVNWPALPVTALDSWQLFVFVWLQLWPVGIPNSSCKTFMQNCIVTWMRESLSFSDVTMETASLATLARSDLPVSAFLAVNITALYTIPANVWLYVSYLLCRNEFLLTSLKPTWKTSPIIFKNSFWLIFVHNLGN